MEVDEAASEKQNPPISDDIKRKKKKKQKKEEGNEKEGSFLLGLPTFSDLGNGRFKCKETGHELPAKENDSYARSKACRLALIDAAVANKKPPLNMFQQCPLSKSKLVCKLTGETINKSEEHIWKHITGKRFQNKLEQKEMENVASQEKAENTSKESKKKSPKSSIDATKAAQKIITDKNTSLKENHVDKNSDSEEPEFWIPPVGNRWDFDDGKDRWEACTTSDHEINEDGLDEGEEQCELESAELSLRTKRKLVAVGPSSFASKKKKKKKSKKKVKKDSKL